MYYEVVSVSRSFVFFLKKNYIVVSRYIKFPSYVTELKSGGI